jgi:nitroreductase
MRVAEYPIESFLIDRWSPRSMSGGVIVRSELLRLFEAARWAPSGGNSQPWRFLFAEREAPMFPAFLGSLVEANQVWAKQAGALIAVLSKTTNDKGKLHATHAFDAGAAWMSLALEASALGLVAHAMGGFDAAVLRAALAIPDGFATHCVVAVGHPASPDTLPEALRGREQPNGRNPVSSFTEAGGFPSHWVSGA